MKFLFRILRGKLYSWLGRQNLDILGIYREYVYLNKSRHKKLRILSWCYLVWLILIIGVVHINIDSINLRTKKSEPFFGPESWKPTRKKIRNFAKELLEQDLIIFDVFEVLVIGLLEKNESTLNLMKNKYIKNHVNQDIDTLDGQNEAELEFYIANPYIKIVFDILQQNGKKIIAFSNANMEIRHLKRLLEKCGYTNLEGVIVFHNGTRVKQGYELQQEIGKSMGIEGLAVVHVGCAAKYIFDSSYSKGWKYCYYRSISDCSLLYRPKGLSQLVGSGYRSLVGAHLHNGIKIYSTPYEFGFIYGGILTLALSSWIHSLALDKNCSEVEFYVGKGETIKKIYDSNSSYTSSKSTLLLQLENEVSKIVKIGDRSFDIKELMMPAAQDTMTLEIVEGFLKEYSSNGKNGLNAVSLNKLMGLLLSPAYPSLILIHEDHVEQVLEFENPDVIKMALASEIQKGIYDFAIKYKQRYGEYEEMMIFPTTDIVGIIKHLLKNMHFAKKYIDMVHDVNHNMFTDYIDEK